jgi:multiple sugar transport system substrate-binding protein
MADFYEQPAYLKELEEDNITISDEKPRAKIPPILIAGIIAFIIIIILIIFLSSSQRPSVNNIGNTNNNPSSSTQKVVLQWWGVFLDKSVIQPLIDEYQVLNPNLTIEYTNKWPTGPFTDSASAYRTELNRVLKENDPVKIPDIFSVHNTWASDYENYSRPSMNIDFDTFKSTYYKSIVTDFSDASTQAVYGLPIWIDTFAIAYNKDILLSSAVSSPPSSWPSFKSLAQNLTVRNAGNIIQAGFSMGHASNTSYAMELFHILMRQNGVNLVNSQNQAIFSESSNTLVSLEYYKSFINQTNGTWSNTLTNDSQMFMEGKLAMLPTTSYRLREYLKINEDFNLNIDVGISQIPQLNGQSQPIYNWVDYWGNMVALNRPNANFTWNFIEWLNRAEQQKKIHQNIKNYYGYFGHLYPRIDMAEELKTDPYLKVFNESLFYAESWKMAKGIEIREEFNKLLNQPTANQNQIAQTNNAINLISTLKGKL